MNLFVTWEKWPGTDVTYQVEYRVYQSGGPFTVFATNLTTNYCTIPNLARNFYEVRVKADCAEGDSDYIYQVTGEDPCQPVIIGPYTVVADTTIYQAIKLTFSNVLPAGAKLRITNLNTNTVESEFPIGVTGSGNAEYTVILNKIEGATVVYRIEVMNICPTINWQLVNDFSIVGPPAEIKSTFRYAEDFCCCDYPNPGNCSRPSAGVRMTFAEPLPQSIRVVFDYCISNGPGPNFCSKNSADGQRAYQAVTVPAGVKSYGCCFWRDRGNEYNDINWCIARIEPAVLNNGKKVTFTNCNVCTNNLQIVDTFIDNWKSCIYQS